MSERATQPDPVYGQPSGSPDPVIRSVERAVDKLETTSQYIERDLDQGRQDVRDLRDRMARLETKVGDLPSKVWIGFVVVGGMAFLSAMVAALAAIFTHLK